jgi:hypothetical protein
MPVTATIDTDAKLITYVVAGDMTLDDVRAAVDAAVKDPRFDQSMNSLWNLKEGRVAISMAELPEMISHLSGIADRRGSGYKVAILVRRNEDFGLSSLFEMHSYSLPFEVQVFRNSDEARTWVTTPSNAKQE